MNFLSYVNFRWSFTNRHAPIGTGDSYDSCIHSLEFLKLERLRNLRKIVSSLPLRPKAVPLVLILPVWNRHRPNIIFSLQYKIRNLCILFIIRAHLLLGINIDLSDLDVQLLTNFDSWELLGLRCRVKNDVDVALFIEFDAVFFVERDHTFVFYAMFRFDIV